MLMEQETMGLLTGGFSLIMGVALVIVLLLLFSKKGKGNRLAYGFVIVFFAFFSWAVSHALDAISFNVDHPMASEEISLRLGTAGVLWGVSMLFLMVGLVKFSLFKGSN
ncbi:hypothetical protein [Bacillus sp. B-jedd]|uniref:hypothetical protein n=1 Tax=Bacillus sp. B-jedd TaxID=1476857 RepID=UPI0005155CA0|nr:hypothetical protein [Bacillus sp. B-jedd]CEG26181.1 hypothetical protein BN1002_01022 [Bacillus sp. B-jedd]